MAARSKSQAPVGSGKWVYDERRQVDQFADQEMEDFTYLAQNEMEWLNEHMAEIFSKTEFEYTEVFKTPGKLRGKTPRTARKGAALESRAPLTDVFAPNSQRTSPMRNGVPMKQPLNFEVAEDKENAQIDAISYTNDSYSAGKENVDSGYYDTQEDEMQVDSPVEYSVQASPQRASPQRLSPPKGLFKPTPQRLQAMKTEDFRPERESTASFVSAKEAPSKSGSVEVIPDVQLEEERAEEAEPLVEPSKAVVPDGLVSRTENQFSVSAETETGLDSALEQAEQAEQAEQESPVRKDDELDVEASLPNTPSPERPTIRKKSSLTFASLPAREPLATKKSVGARNSRTSHLDPARPILSSHDSQISRMTTAKSLTGAQQIVLADEEPEIEADDKDVLATDDDTTQMSKTTSATKLHSKHSTQSLHDRIAMLGKSNTSQLSKSKSLGLISSQNLAISSQKNQNQESATEDDDNDEEWIKPIKDSRTDEELPTSQAVPVKLHSTGIAQTSGHPTDEETAPQSELIPIESSLDVVAQPSITEKQVSDDSKPANTAYPVLATIATESTTPVGSPMISKHTDGPLSASKAKLYSVFKTAKGIFASSAGVSAQAKMETLSPQSSRVRLDAHQPSLAEVFTQSNGAEGKGNNLYPQLPKSQNHASEEDEDQEFKSGSETQTRRRSSQRVKQAQEKADMERKEQSEAGSAPKNIPSTSEEGKPAPTQSSQSEQTTERQTIQKVPQDDASDMPPPPPPKSSSRLQNPGEAKRPPKPSKDLIVKAKPAPVSIRVPSLAAQKAGHMQQSAPTTTSSQESAAPPPPPKPTLTKKGSNSSLKSSTTSSRPKALEAAARKKEQDEREAQRKAEQKRELERRRAVKQEEEKRAQEQKVAEERRANELKLAAQKQAAEQRKAEVARKAELQRGQAGAAHSKAFEEVSNNNQPAYGPELTLAQPARPERSIYSQSNPPKTDFGTSRPVSRDMSRPPVPHINPAKPPAKRQFQVDDDDQFQFSRVQKPGVATANNAAKRRRTSEESTSLEQQQQRPTMAPPIRRSNMGKEMPNKYTHGFMHASSSHAGPPSMHKTALTNQQSMQHPKTPHMNDLATYHQGRIPFAENANPPQGQPHPPQSQPLNRSVGHHNSKTPGSSKTPKHTSSPQYPNGDHIELPEIATDSEDSDDGGDNDFIAPSWADSPALRELLRQQQLVDPLKVFGPIGPLVMEDVFKGNKERQAKFRNRTSSANWNGPDRLTEEERRRDWEAREKFEKEGGWTYGAGFNSGPSR